jgi:hypothetical protein
MATPAPVIKYFFDAASGAPLVGGQVYTYAAGGASPLVTYQNAAQTVANPNPIILGARGDADIWLQAGTAYRFDVYDSLGVLQFTVDGVTADGTMAAQNADAVAITGGTMTGVNLTLTDASTILGEAIGYRIAPQISSAVTYILALADSGKHVYLTTAGTAVNIPANALVAFPIGTAVTVVNGSAGNTNITISTDTLRLAATGSTGTRTLVAYGVCTLLKVGPALWLAFGAGLS